MPAFIYISFKNSTPSIKLIDNLIMSPDILTLWKALLTLDYTIRKLLEWSCNWLSSCCQWQND